MDDLFGKVETVKAPRKVKSPCCNRVCERVDVGGWLVRWICPCGKAVKAKDFTVPRHSDRL